MEFIFQKLNDVKTGIANIKTVGEEHKKSITELEDNLNEAERYQRRRNLRLYGLTEQEGEYVKTRVVIAALSFQRLQRLVRITFQPQSW